MPVELTLGPKPGHAKLKVEGHDISGACQEIQVYSSVSEMPTVMVRLAMAHGVVDGVMRLVVHPRTVAMLGVFGWNPPEGAEVREDGSVVLTLVG
jgi:hypothetical protein